MIDYTVQDGDGTISSAQLTIELAPDSEPVVTADDAVGTETDGTLTASGTIVADFGADGGSLALSATDATWDDETATLTADDRTWSVTLDGDGYEFTQYGPLATASATDPGDPLSVDVTVIAMDGDGDTASDVFSVSLTDEGPVVNDAAATQAVEDTPVTHNVLIPGDADPGLFGGSLVAAELAEDSPYNGAVTYNADGTITYTPASGETGTVVIDYVVEDADGDTGMARLFITLAADSAPVITTTNVTGDETGSLATGSGLLSVDFGADGADAVIALAAAGATWDGETATLTANDGSWAIETENGEYAFTQYAPLDHADFNDPDDPYLITVGITATDGDGTMSTGTFTVTVDDDGPVATDAAFVQDTAPDAAASYNVFLGGDALTGADGGALTGAALAADGDYGGTVTYTADGNITYTPVEGETGTVDIDYMVTDQRRRLGHGATVHRPGPRGPDRRRGIPAPATAGKSSGAAAATTPWTALRERTSSSAPAATTCSSAATAGTPSWAATATTGSKAARATTCSSAVRATTCSSAARARTPSRSPPRTTAWTPCSTSSRPWTRSNCTNPGSNSRMRPARSTPTCSRPLTRKPMKGASTLREDRQASSTPARTIAAPERFTSTPTTP